jgi:hypothetical protein
MLYYVMLYYIIYIVSLWRHATSMPMSMIWCHGCTPSKALQYREPLPRSWFNKSCWRRAVSKSHFPHLFTQLWEQAAVRSKQEEVGCTRISMVGMVCMVCVSNIQTACPIVTCFVQFHAVSLTRSLRNSEALLWKQPTWDVCHHQL